ncbi:hypothetical protein [Propionimicrobium sp. PCR01-08-3]|uniref:hypothetical protein n=1 Tax=Propionimicrobium sp. PCR01-08-3 TaxID=3052086 RepID=UPI00255C8613|nr:hypothetical protein [Propionimicrobium sp. PCR01-08-3]WIY82729.1 hypothetical protein QQ658_14720 [Propionimicrobium sp. PCR01-08-3]
MSDTVAGTDRTSRYALKPQHPVRAWVIAVILVLGGAALIWAGLGAGDTRNTVVIVVGSIVAVLGVVMGIAALTFVSNSTLYVTLSPDGFEVSGPGYHKSGAWIDVDSVSTTPDGSRLVIGQGHVERTFIQAPGGIADEQMKALTDDIATRLRAQGS